MVAFLSVDAAKPAQVATNFVQTGGTLLANVENPVQGGAYNVMAVAGTAALGGTLEINAAVNVGESFSITLTANAITGSFSSVVGRGGEPQPGNEPEFRSEDAYRYGDWPRDGGFQRLGNQPRLQRRSGRDFRHR